MANKKYIAGAVALIAIILALKPHSEEALMSDWSAPPPWPVFIALNVLAGVFRSVADALTPPPIAVLDMATAYHKTIFVHVAQKLNIPDKLAKGPMTSAEIAAAAKTEESIVERLMFACAANGIFKLTKPAADGSPRFINTALSAVLRKDHPNTQWAMVAHNAEDVFGAWAKLPEVFANPSGPIAWDLANPAYPFKKGGIWKLFEDKPDREAQFAAAMTSLDSLGANAMVADGPWAKFAGKTVHDVGGGQGHFMHRILEAHPSIKGVVVDRPPVIELAKKAYGAGGAFSSVAADRIRFVGGSFFEPKAIPPAQDGDAYFMRYILHDWPKKDALQILKNVRAAMGDKKATLVVGECALPDHGVVGVPPVMYGIDIQMLAAFGEAQERTPAQWKGIFAEAGFELVAIHPTRSLLHWVEAKPV